MMVVLYAPIAHAERTPRKWCDTKSLVASGHAGWRADEVGDIATGQCSRPVSALMCVAGNGGVRSAGFKPKGSRSIRGPQVRVAETSYTAFTSKNKALHVTARLIVRRVRDKNKDAGPGQGELFPAWRYYAVFTD